MSKNQDGKVQWNRRLSPETVKLITALAEKNKRSDTNMIEVLVAEAARAQRVTVKRDEN